MALRLVDVYLPADYDDSLDWGEEHSVLGRWDETLNDGQHLTRALIDSEDTDAFLEWLDTELSLESDYRIVLMPVEATIPRPEKDEDDDEEETADDATEEDPSERSSTARISREELYQDINDSVQAETTHYLLVLLSTIVAAGGMLRNSPAVVIGAMVIAPLIGPNIALALGTTLGDTQLLIRSLRVNVGSLLLALVLSVTFGLMLPVDPTIPEIALRTQIGLADVILALAAGVAGALSFTRGVSTALIGVMVAVALLPPLVALGMLLGAGNAAAAYGAFLLLCTNVVAVNLAGVVTFLAQGIQPMKWYEAKQAKKATRIAVALWVLALAILVVAILLAS